MCNGSQACGGSEARQGFHSKRAGFVTTVIGVVALWRFSISVGKHVNNTDVAFRALCNDQETSELTVYWYDIGKCHKPRPMNIIQDICIKAEDVSNWKELPIE